MATPLELYLQVEYKDKHVPVPISTKVAAIGTDNKWSDLLLELYKELEDKAINANCLSAYMVNEGIEKWTEKLNKDWIEETANDPTETFYIAHLEVNKALVEVAKSGDITLAAFDKYYEGKENATYDEIVVIIGRGYVKFEDSGISINNGNATAGILKKE